MVGNDFDGVIVKAYGRGQQDTALTGAEDAQLAMPGVFEVVKQLVDHCDGDVWIVSKARSRMQTRTRNWLETVRFYGRTGLPREQLIFCLNRADKEPICRELEVTHFIDDEST